MIAIYARDILDGIAARQGTAGRGISPEALNLLNNYSWPGNIRELENVCQSAATFGKTAVLCAARHPVAGPRQARAGSGRKPARGSDVG